jgi:hypothetical protein
MRIESTQTLVGAGEVIPGRGIPISFLFFPPFLFNFKFRQGVMGGRIVEPVHFSYGSSKRLSNLLCLTGILVPCCPVSMTGGNRTKKSNYWY